MATQALVKRDFTPLAQSIEKVLIGGDLSELNPEQRLGYYRAVCDSVGLNPLTKPFEYIKLNGKLTLYAKRDATDQLRKLHCVSIEEVKTERFDDIFVVTAKARDNSGRTDSSTGAVSLAGKRGDDLANAIMKAETKAKRRVTLSICGLGLLDETELETIKEVQVTAAPRHDTPQVVSAPGSQGGSCEPAPTIPTPTITGIIENIRQGKDRDGRPNGWWFNLSGDISILAKENFDCEQMRGRKGFEVVCKGIMKETRQGKVYYELTDILSVSEPSPLAKEPESNAVTPDNPITDNDLPF